MLESAVYAKRNRSSTCYTGRMETEAPLRSDAERNRRRILAAAEAVFATEGVQAPMEHVARRAGVGIGTLYRRFPNREALIEMLFADRLSRLYDALEDSRREPDAWVAIVRFFELMLEFQTSASGLTGFLVGRLCGPAQGDEVRGRLLPLVEETVERAKEQGTLRDGVTTEDIVVVVYMLGGVAAGLGREASRRYLQIMLDGLRAEGSRPGHLPAQALSVDLLEGSLAGPARTSR